MTLAATPASSAVIVPSYHEVPATMTAAAPLMRPMNSTLFQDVTRDPRQGAALLRAASTHVTQASSSFGTAPLPDEDIQAPTESTPDTAHFRPDFFHRLDGSFGDGEESDHANQQRRGHGSASCGLALAVPLSQ
ncbi:hypothetical protein [Gluconobacter morbifer]|nr:hypothetical protein [Gluconobacter morbifer]